VVRVKTYRDEQIRHQLLILVPAFTILSPTPLNIPMRAVDDHAGEEQRVEPRKWAAEPSDETPGISKEEVAGIVDLPGVTVPPVGENRVSSLGLDDAGVLNRLPGELRERLPFEQQATLLDAEAVLLRVGSVPYPVYKKVRNKERGHKVRVPAVGGRWVVGKVQDAVAVAQRHASQVPEDQHKAPFLIVHVPGILREGG
jgi:hypothetical protein